MSTHRNLFAKALAADTTTEHPLAGMFTPAEIDELDGLCPAFTPAEMTKEF